MIVDERFMDVVKRFSFPLNVYAWCLLKETGRVCNLHYGLFIDPKESVEVAQQRSTDYLFENLPKPCRILEVGVGVGSTLKRLLQSGYAAVGITPDAEQASVARQVCGDKDAVIVSSFESFPGIREAWDLILFQESGQYIDPVDLFERCSDLLKPQGEIVLLDEFALMRSEIGEENLHFFDHFKAIGDRFGFELIEHFDLGGQAALTVDYLLSMLDKHKASLIDDLKISANQIESLVASNRRYRQYYNEGRFGYRLLKFRRSKTQSQLPRRIRSEHAQEVCALFSSVFKKEMSQALWVWKYGENRGQAIGIWDQGKLVAHYGGISRRVNYFGQEILASQSADVMASSDSRKSLSKKSAFFMAAATFLEVSVGFGRRHLLGFGFPNERARRAPELLGLYSSSVGNILELSWDLKQTSLLRLFFRCVRLNLDRSNDLVAVEHCWQLMKSTTGDYIVGIRDASWLAHRYANHPDHHYEIYAIGLKAQALPFGVVVLRRHSDGRTEWVDAVSARSRFKWLVTGLQNITDQPIGRLFAWVSELLIPLLPPGAEVVDLNVGIPSSAWTPGPSTQTLQGKWWLMGGDTDFR
jgi:SAM-dependent methyltransferase